MSGSSKEKETLHMLGIESGLSDLVSVQCSADECYCVCFGLDRTGPFSDCHVLMCFSQFSRSKEYIIQVCKLPQFIALYHNW
jgi:hypothetical protein